MNTPLRIAPGFGVVFTLNSLNNDFSTYIFVFATPIFLFMVMRTANKRDHFTPTQHWLPFLVCGVTVLVVLSLAWLLPYPQKYYYSVSAVVFYMGEAVTIVILILLLLMCFMCCCCSSGRLHMDYSDPVVYNARSRLAWTCVFIAFVPLVPDFTPFGRYYTKVTFNLDSFHTTMVMIPVFLFLPTYRSSLFSCCQNRREKNLPNKVAPPSPLATVAVINPRNVAPPTLTAPPLSAAPPVIPSTFSQPIYHAQNQTLMIPKIQHQALYPNLNVPTSMNVNPPAMNPTLNIGGHVLQLPQQFIIETPNATIISSPR